MDFLSSVDYIICIVLCSRDLKLDRLVTALGKQPSGKTEETVDYLHPERGQLQREGHQAEWWEHSREGFSA